MMSCYRNMPTEEVQKQVNKLFDIKKGGIASVFAAFVSTFLVLLNLPPESIVRLKEIWYIPAFLSSLLLFSLIFVGYITEKKNQIQVEVRILDKLELMATNFERLFAHHLDDKIHSEKRLDTLEDLVKTEAADTRIYLRKIYDAMEKREGYIPGKDTERFMNGS